MLVPQPTSWSIMRSLPGPLVIVPAHLRFAVGDRNHRDAIINGAHERTKIAADAILLAHVGNGLARNPARAKAIAVGVYQVDALVRAIFAGDVTKIAADALVIVDPRDALVVQ